MIEIEIIYIPPEEVEFNRRYNERLEQKINELLEIFEVPKEDLYSEKAWVQ